MQKKHDRTRQNDWTPQNKMLQEQYNTPLQEQYISLRYKDKT